MNPTTFSTSENQKTSQSTPVLQIYKVLLITVQENDSLPEGSNVCQAPLAQTPGKSTVNTLNEVVSKNEARKSPPMFTNSSHPSSSHEPYNEIKFCYLTIKEALHRRDKGNYFANEILSFSVDNKIT